MSDGMILWAIVIAYMAFIFFKGVSKVRKVHEVFSCVNAKQLAFDFASNTRLTRTRS